MSTTVETKFHLTGPLRGKTINLGSMPYPFTNGVMVLRGTPEDIALHARFLERNWQAYPEGHDKLKEAQDGERDVQTDSKQDAEPQVQGGVQPEGEGAQAGDGADDGTGTTEAATGETGGVADGDGPQAELNEKLQRAVLSLDPDVDDHWTKDGQPAMSAVEKLYGSTAITRADVRAAAQGHTRDKAREAKGEA